MSDREFAPLALEGAISSAVFEVRSWPLSAVNVLLVSLPSPFCGPE